MNHAFSFQFSASSFQFPASSFSGLQVQLQVQGAVVYFG